MRESSPSLTGSPLSLTTHIITSPLTIAPEVPVRVLTRAPTSEPVDQAAMLRTFTGTLPQRQAGETREGYVNRALTEAAKDRWTSGLTATVHTDKSFAERYEDTRAYTHLAEYMGTAPSEERTAGHLLLAVVNDDVNLIDIGTTASALLAWSPWIAGSLVRHAMSATCILNIFSPDMALDHMLRGADESEFWYEQLFGTPQALLTRAETRALSPEERRAARKQRRQYRYSKEGMRERRECLDNTEVMRPKDMRKALRPEVLDAQQTPLSLHQLTLLADHPATTPIQRRAMRHIIGVIEQASALQDEVRKAHAIYPEFNDDTGHLYGYVLETGGHHAFRTGYHGYDGLVAEAANEDMEYTSSNCSHITPLVTYCCPMEHFPALLTVVDRFMNTADRLWTSIEDWPTLGITPEMAAAADEVQPAIPEHLKKVSAKTGLNTVISTPAGTTQPGA